MNENVSMQGYDVDRYYRLLLIMRTFYDQTQLSPGNRSFQLLMLKTLLLIASISWFAFERNLIGVGVVTAIGLTSLFGRVWAHNEDDDFHDGFIELAAKNGFDRKDAIEFLHDFEWDDVQYEDSHLDYFREKIKNAKNQ